jgi:L-galactose dehydrogenase
VLYRTLGKTGLNVSILGFGASPLGNEFSTIDPQEGQRAVHCAIDLGINYFDVSPYYGRTLAETRLGEALVGRRDRVILATKCGRYGAKDEAAGFDFSAERITRSVDESLHRLHTDYIDVLQAHDIEFADRQQIIGETLPAMFRLKESGKIRFVGITAYPLYLLRDVAVAGAVDTVLSFCRYDLLDNSLDEVLAPAAREHGFGLINASPLHMGALSQRGAPAWHQAPERVLDAARRAASYCQERGADIADLAMQFALAYPLVATTLAGMSKVAHVERNAALVGAPPHPELLAAVSALLASSANVVWYEGRVENRDPGAIPARS